MIARTVCTRLSWREIAQCLQQTTGGFGLALVAFGTILAGCSKSTDPPPIRYNLYVGDTVTDQMYILDPDSLIVRDSIPNLGRSLDMVTSPDGQWLYVSRVSSVEGDPLVKFSLRANQRSVELSGYGSDKLGLLENGEMVLWGNEYFYGGNVDAPTLSQVRLSSDSLRWRGGPEIGTKIAAGFFPGGVEGPSSVRVLDLATGQFSGSYVPHLQSGESVGAYQATLLSDDRRVVVAGPARSGRWVLVGDITTGETLFQFRRLGGHGEVAISPDGKFAAVSDPSSIGYPEATEPGVDIIDLQHLTHPKRFRPADFGTEAWEHFSQVQFTPDGRRAVVAPEPGTPGRIRVINLATLSVENVTWPDTGFAWIGALGYGPQPR